MSAEHMHKVLRKVPELVFISGVLRGSYISGTKGEVSEDGIGILESGKRTPGLGNFTDLDLTLLGRNSPNGRRIFEGVRKRVSAEGKGDEIEERSNGTKVPCRRGGRDGADGSGFWLILKRRERAEETS